MGIRCDYLLKRAVAFLILFESKFLLWASLEFEKGWWRKFLFWGPLCHKAYGRARLRSRRYSKIATQVRSGLICLSRRVLGSWLSRMGMKPWRYPKAMAETPFWIRSFGNFSIFYRSWGKLAAICDPLEPNAPLGEDRSETCLRFLQIIVSY